MKFRLLEKHADGKGFPVWKEAISSPHGFETLEEGREYIRVQDPFLTGKYAIAKPEDQA